jgi:Fe2+ or Zn2+ uptake regulation protein
MSYMSLYELLEEIKAMGGRMTRTRKTVLETLLSSARPLSVSEIGSVFKSKKISINRTTIYRELSFLIKNGFIHEVRLIGKPSLFELVHEHRHHLICTKCDAVKPVVLGRHLDSHEKKIMRHERFKITSHSLEFYGLCEKCQ